MKKYMFGVLLVVFCVTCFVSVCSAKEILIDAKGAVQIDDRDVPPINPPTYRHIEQKKFDVKLNNPQYIKDIPAINNRERKFDLQLKRPCIQPYQSYQQ